MGVKKGSGYIKKVTASPWEMIYYYENGEEGIHLTITLTPHQPFTKDHHITRQSIKREAITMLKVVIHAMCFEGDIAFVTSELKAKASLREFTCFCRFTVDQFVYI